MHTYNFKFKEEPLLNSRQDKWVRGLNVLVSATQINAEEVAEMTDCQLVEDGKIQCPRDGQAYYGATSGSRVRGLYSYYKADGTKQLLRTVGTTLQKYTSSTTWTNITGYTYTNDLNTNGVTTYDRLYLCNGTDPLTYYDGTSITSFTAIGAANTPTVTPTGGTGAFTFSYKIVAVTNVGGSAPSAAGTATSGQATLDTTHYMSLSWSATTNAVGYSVYGRKDGKWYYMTYLDGNTNTTYVDKGQDTPNAAFPTTDLADSTAGPKGKYVAVYKDSLFVAGDPAFPTRLYYSGGGDQVNNFTVGGGGGFIDISRNDGQAITGLIVFKNTLLVFKEDSIYQFSYTSTGLPQIAQTNPSLGAIAPRSIIAVENDIFFASRRGVFTIGNEQGFAFDVLRTNELSSRVRNIFRSIDPAYIQNISATYTSDADKNLVIFSYTPSGSTTNSKALIYDRERLGWYRWTNIQANCWTIFRATDGVTHYLYGDDSSGYVKEILSGSSDFGSAIHGYFYLRGEDFQKINQYKILKDIDILLRKPSGAISLSIVQDGVNTVFGANVGTINPSINFGHYVFNRFQFKTAYGVGVSSADELTLRTKKNTNLEGKTFQLRFDNNSSASFVLLFAGMTGKARSPRYRKSADLFS